jgi:hypothetical protein
VTPAWPPAGCARLEYSERAVGSAAWAASLGSEGEEVYPPEERWMHLKSGSTGANLRWWASALYTSTSLGAGQRGGPCHSFSEKSRRGIFVEFESPQRRSQRRDSDSPRATPLDGVDQGGVG